MRISNAFVLTASLIATLAAAPLAARRDDPEVELAKMLAGRTAGPPKTCIPLNRNTSSQTIDGIGIVYDFGRTLYVNRFTQGCSALDSSRILVTRTTTTQLCRGDVAQVMTQTPSMLVGTCIFDNFVPYTKAK